MKVFLLLFFLVGVEVGFSKLIDHSITLKRMEIFTIKEACQTLGHTDLLLVDKKDKTRIDCMGTYENVTKFCEKKFPKDPTLTRGYIESTADQVICEKGRNVFLKISCDKRDLAYCKNPKAGCEKLGKAFAVRHELFRSTRVKLHKGQALNCYFTMAEDENKAIENLKESIIR